MSAKQSSIPINENIKIRTLVIIDDTGNNLGEMSRDEALSLAMSKNLDLVLISNKNGIAIAKILNYGKFKYEQKRKVKDNKKSQIIIKNKEVKVKPLIGDHDLQVRANNANKWLLDGDRVSFIIEARGRMSTKPEYVNIVYDKFIKMIEENGKVQIEKKRVNDFRYETLIVPKK